MYQHCTLALLWLEKLDPCAQLAYPSQTVTNSRDFLLWPLKREENWDADWWFFNWMITYRTQGLKATRVERLLALMSIFSYVFNKINQSKTKHLFQNAKKCGARNEEVMKNKFCDDLAAIIDFHGMRPWTSAAPWFFSHSGDLNPERFVETLTTWDSHSENLVGRRPRTVYRHILSFCYIETSEPRLARELLVRCLRVGHTHLAKSITFVFISWTCGFKFWNCQETIQKNWNKPIRMMSQDYCFISMGKWMVNHVLFCMLQPPTAGPQRAKRMSQPPRMDMI